MLREELVRLELLERLDELDRLDELERLALLLLPTLDMILLLETVMYSKKLILRIWIQRLRWK